MITFAIILITGLIVGSIAVVQSFGKQPPPLPKQPETPRQLSGVKFGFGFSIGQFFANAFLLLIAGAVLVVVFLILLATVH